MNDKFLVVLAGWNVGFRTIDLMKIVREHAKIDLAQAKAAVERVLNGEEVAFAFETEEAASTFSALAVSTGAIVRREC